MKNLFSFLFILLSLPSFSQDALPRQQVVLETDSGNIRIELFNETPLHRDNFLKNVREGIYDGVLFHRVITNFMIQTGDTVSRHAVPGQLLGESKEGEKIPAEIRFPEIFHKRGSLAAAREGDEVNPERKSSQHQFYIVWGRRLSDMMLDQVQDRLDEATGGQIKLTPELREAYQRFGGTPHLDGQYTVFGQVVEGLDVVNRIQWAETDVNNRPLNDIRIIKAKIVE
ncbi:MAG: peptidylprolyl isomerase [Prevotella sp.]|nr:peptidylprolyl isomerase [Prevotella sp.]